MYYPGNEFVDVLGLTLYNTGNYYEGENWAEFSELYRPLYEKAVKEYAMPFMITEFASARCGGNKEDWTRKMLSEIGSYPNIKAAVWWNHADLDWEGNVSRAYYINDTTEMTDIFKEYFSMR
jgi:beta-mannanase